MTAHISPKEASQLAIDTVKEYRHLVPGLDDYRLAQAMHFNYEGATFTWNRGWSLEVSLHVDLRFDRSNNNGECLTPVIYTNFSSSHRDLAKTAVLIDLLKGVSRIGALIQTQLDEFAIDIALAKEDPRPAVQHEDEMGCTLNVHIEKSTKGKKGKKGK